MPLEMMRGKQAIAVGDEYVRATTGTHSVVTTKCHAEALVLVRGEFDRKTRGTGKLVHDVVCPVLRTVVDDDHLKAAFHVDLLRERRQRPLEVARPLVGRQNHREFQPRRHAAMTFPHGLKDRAAAICSLPISRRASGPDASFPGQGGGV